MKQVLLFSIFSFCLQFVNAAINPLYKECMQRDYSVRGDYCVFPDSTECLLTEFNKKECGLQWFTEDYCIKEGLYVWDVDKCCEGLVAYLPDGVAGQATCQSKIKVYPRQVLEGPSLWIMALIIVLLLGALFFLKAKSKRGKS